MTRSTIPFAAAPASLALKRLEYELQQQLKLSSDLGDLINKLEARDPVHQPTYEDTNHVCNPQRRPSHSDPD